VAPTPQPRTAVRAAAERPIGARVGPEPEARAAPPAGARRHREPEPEAAPVRRWTAGPRSAQIPPMADETLDPMDPARWRAEPGVCGSCIAWRTEDPRPGDEVAPGACKLRPELGRVPATMRKCDLYRARAELRGAEAVRPLPSSPKRRRNKLLRSVVIDEDGAEVDVTPIERPRVERAPRPSVDRPRAADRDDEDEADARDAHPAAERRPEHVERPVRAEVPSEVDLGGPVAPELLKNALRELVHRELGVSRRELGDKWKRGGKVLVAERGGAYVERPIESLFSALDRFQLALDGVERIAKSRRERLGAELSAELVDGVKKIRGSFTTFNVVYAHKDDWFSSK
jgi:hypothetical protein